MGYYSTVEIDSFYTKKTEEECEAIRKKVLESKSKLFPSFDMINEVVFSAYTSDNPDLVKKGLNLISCDIDEQTQKWDYEAEYGLAILISLIMDPNEGPIDVTMHGEDGERWGWRVRSGRINPLQSVWVEKEETIELSKESIVEALI